MWLALQVAVVICVVVGFVSALFLCFVSAIGSEQWEAIRSAHRRHSTNLLKPVNWPVCAWLVKPSLPHVRHYEFMSA